VYIKKNLNKRIIHGKLFDVIIKSHLIDQI
jgi:hypothetical protein